MEITEDLFDDILKDGGSQYFFYQEDTGEIIVIFRSSMEKFEPGEEDFIGRVWSPKIMDAQGNPLLDNKGNPREPWAKFEAKATINNIDQILSMGGRKSPLLNNFIRAMKREDVSNKDLVGTKWSINKVGPGYNDWDIKYLGKEEEESSSTSPQKEEKGDCNKIDDKIIEALKAKKDQTSNGVSKNDIISYLAFITHKKADEINEVWNDLIEQKIISIKDNKIYIN